MAQSVSETWEKLFQEEGTEREYCFYINGTKYGAESEVSHSVTSSLYDSVSIGNAGISTLTLEIYADEIPRGATIKRYLRLKNGDAASEWLPKGTFFTNRRMEDDGLWTLEAYDSMRKADAVFITDGYVGQWPRECTAIAMEIAERIGAKFDSRNVLDNSVLVDYPNDDSMRTVLEKIGAANGGNWIITDDCKMRFIPLNAAQALQEVGQDCTSFTDNGKTQAITMVTLTADDSTSFSAGDSTGAALEAECSFASQEIADAVLEKVSGYQIRMYTAEAANLDPAVELGDAVNVCGITSIVAEISDDGSGYLDISVPGEQELEDEFPYEGPLSKSITNRLAEKVSLGTSYYGTTITHADGIKVERTDGENVLADVTLNADKLEFTQDGTPVFYYDALEKTWKLSASMDVEVVGNDGGKTTLSAFADSITGQVQDLDQSTSAQITALSDRITTEVKDLDSEVSAKIDLKIDKTDNSQVVSMINASASEIDLESDKLTIKSGQFQLEGGKATFSGKMGGDDSTAYVDVSADGFNVCRKDGTAVCKIRYSVDENGWIYPYMIYGIGNGQSGTSGLIKKFTNGFWFGTSGQEETTGDFLAQTGDYGFFINIETGKLYAVVNSSMENLYTGDAIARFG
jgi:hypothetical protein